MLWWNYLRWESTDLEPDHVEIEEALHHHGPWFPWRRGNTATTAEHEDNVGRFVVAVDVDVDVEGDRRTPLLLLSAPAPPPPP